MKWIQKFEARRSTKNDPAREEALRKQEEDAIKNYQYHIEDLDEVSAITFDQFFDSLDLNMFGEHSNDFYGAGISAPKNSGTIRINDYSIWDHREYGPYAPAGLGKSEDWKKRNLFFWAEVNTGGASGGSCWDTGDDDGAQPYYGNSLELRDFIYNYLKPILKSILEMQATTVTADELCDILYNSPQNIGEDSRSNYEYYGNYDDYSCHYMTLENLFIFLSKNGGF
jgi:hypothetical protein